MRPRAVFFDAGYTLLHAVPSLGGVYAEVTRRFGVEAPPARFEAAFGPVFERFNARVRADEEFRESDAENRAMWEGLTRDILEEMPELRGRVPFAAWFDALYVRFAETASWNPYPDALPTLAALKEEGLRVSILSNWDSRLLGILAGHGLDSLVDDIVVSARVGFRKPHPAIFAEACRRADVAPDEAVHVGDSLHDDVGGARRAGIAPVLIRRRDDGAPPGVPTIRGLSELTGGGLSRLLSGEGG